ncbi:caspase-8-like [Ptychodera flava]|uniref:caspase-8-like n=1 Tax=Ptychodera flava TaxID=63121 RepID=UPI003969D60D
MERIPSDFRIRLLNVKQELTSDEFTDMKYLLKDKELLQQKDVDSMETPWELFSWMEEQGYLSPQNMYVLKKLLDHIGRKDLIKKHMVVQPSGSLNSY